MLKSCQAVTQIDTKIVFTSSQFCDLKIVTTIRTFPLTAQTKIQRCYCEKVDFVIVKSIEKERNLAFAFSLIFSTSQHSSFCALRIRYHHFPSTTLASILKQACKCHCYLKFLFYLLHLNSKLVIKFAFLTLCGETRNCYIIQTFLVFEKKFSVCFSHTHDKSENIVRYRTILVATTKTIQKLTSWIKVFGGILQEMMFVSVVLIYFNTRSFVYILFRNQSVNNLGRCYCRLLKQKIKSFYFCQSYSVQSFLYLTFKILESQSSNRYSFTIA